MTDRSLASLLALLFAFAACSRSDSEARPEPAPMTASAKPGPTPSEAPSGAPTGPMMLARGIRIEHAGAGADAAKVILDAKTHASADGRDLVVYVGAKWCEPCQRFHKAAAAGDLDADFPELTLLEFDLDEDRDRLSAAGYTSQFIPLFAMPGPDGHSSEKHFEGSVKGDLAVANIAPRLRKLLKK